MSTNLQKSLDLLIKNQIDNILDRISEYYNINREELESVGYGKSVGVSVSNEGKCIGVTRKGEKCTNKTKPNSNYCGRHDIIS
jgi:hypothetical protein